MSSDPTPLSEPSPEEIRLGELVDQYQEIRAEDGTLGVGSLRVEAGELFPELAELAECLDLLQVGCGCEEESIPSHFGPYRLEALLGSGVSGQVYRARRGDTGPPVALKVIRETIVLDPTATERFHREIRAVAQIDHPHCVGIVDHGDVGGRPYIAMELLEGESLSGLIDRIRDTGHELPEASWLRVLDEAGVPPAPDLVASIAEQYARRLAGLFAPVARAIAAAARMELIHRDLKPGNLVLTDDGHLVVIDFGLAKIVGEEITSTMAILGTPGFMSPEQAAGRSRDVDARSDVYGLGATLYRAVTLRHPVEADSLSEVLAAILNVVPEPIVKITADFPAGLSRCLAHSLEKDPRDRYPDADAFADDLERVATGRRPRSASVPAGRRAAKLARRYGLVTAATIAAILLGYLWFTRSGGVDVTVWPGGEIVLDGRVVAVDRWSERLSRGEYELAVTRPGFLPWRETVRIEAGDEHHYRVDLRPENEYDPGALTRMASAYGVSAPTAATPTGYRGGPLRTLPIPPPERPEALSEQLARWPASEHDRPSIRLLAIQALLDDGLPFAAYAAAHALWLEDEERALPLRLALVALERAGFHDNREFTLLRGKLLEIEDE